jgi:hypothetical protein
LSEDEYRNEKQNNTAADKHGPKNKNKSKRFDPDFKDPGKGEKTSK